MPGCVKPRDAFDQDAVSKKLRKCMKGLGTDEEPIIMQLSNCSNEQRQWVAESFQQGYGKALMDDLKGELSGDMEETVVAMMTPPVDYDCNELNRAIKGCGTLENVLVEIMVSRSNDELDKIKERYEELHGESLQAALDSDTDGYFGRMMISLCTAAREGNDDADDDLAETDAKLFLEAGDSSWGTDEAELNKVLCLRSFAQLRRTFDKFEELSEGKTIEESISGEVSGALEDGYLAMVQIVRHKPQFFAKRLNKAIACFGTEDADLIRIIVSRSEIDLEDIKEEYQALYDKSLEEAIDGDCGGNYKRLLLSLCNPPELVEADDDE